MMIPTYSRYPHDPKIWCQVNIDDRPVFWTDSSWRIVEPRCYAGGQPRCHAGLEYAESVNLKEFPAGWQLPGFNDRNWPVARIVSPVTASGSMGRCAVRDLCPASRTPRKKGAALRFT